MKKVLSIFMCSLMVFSFIGCGTSTKESTIEEKSQEVVQEKKKDVEITKLSAEQIINEYKVAGFPVDNIIVYTEESDKNNLLGRPNQYISKINFSDTRVEQSDDLSNPVGGSIEVFNNEEDALKRKDYVEAISKSVSMFSQYFYLYKNVLFRLDHQLTPTQAKEYESAFTTMQNGDKPKYTESK